MQSYSDGLKEHLAQYKCSRLGVDANGIWFNNGRSYPHILPVELSRLNVLETIRAEFWAYFDAHRNTLPLHTDFHHLNSSQAFAFNLLFPWVSEHPTLLLEALGVEPGEVAAWSFEAMLDPAEQTTVDLWIQMADARQVLIEVKLTESSFGTTLANDSRRRKLARIYAPRLQERTTAGTLEEPAFFLNYQLLRNVSHLDGARGDRLVLLLPRANVGTWEEGLRFCRERLTEEAQAAVRVIAAEDLHASLRAGGGSAGRLAAHLELLVEKYFPALTIGA